MLHVKFICSQDITFLLYYKFSSKKKYCLAIFLTFNRWSIDEANNLKFSNLQQDRLLGIDTSNKKIKVSV